MKTILVTGATSGFGAAFSRRFIRDGHRVIATGRRQSLLADLAAECGEHICAYQLDVTDLGSVDSFLSDLPEEWRKIDVLVNNAADACQAGLKPPSAAPALLTSTSTLRSAWRLKSRLASIGCRLG